MTREELRNIIYVLKSVYTQQNFIPDQAAFNVWYEMLKDLPRDVAEQAARKHILSEKFPPAIADIRREAAEITAPRDAILNELEAWHLVSRALRNSIYGGEQEYERLPPAVRRAIGSPQTLRDWAVMDRADVETVEQSHFIRCYRAEQARAKNLAQLPEQMRMRLEDPDRTS